jgi:hypothetical protein
MRIQHIPGLMIAATALTGCFYRPRMAARLSAATYSYQPQEFKATPKSQEVRNVTKLPPVLDPGAEVWLGYRALQSGFQENYLGSQGKCIFIFQLDPKRHQMIGWHFKFKEDECDCLQ